MFYVLSCIGLYTQIPHTCPHFPPSYLNQVRGMMDCLYAECKPCITDCVMAELEKLGQKYRVALKVAKVWIIHMCE